MSSFDFPAARDVLPNELGRARHLLHTNRRTKNSTMNRMSVDAPDPLHAQRHGLDRNRWCRSISAVRVRHALRENGDAQWLDTAPDAGEFGGVYRVEAPGRRRGVWLADHCLAPSPPQRCGHL
jgi:hypothetical protein